MNAIFAIVFLAATVAAQSYDFDRTTDLNKILLKNKFGRTYDDLSVIDLLRNTGHLGKEFNTRVQTPWVLPTSYYNNKVDTTIFTLDEIVRHPLFRQYLTLPLFRQYLSSPLFQYYLTTPLFQQYWTIPQFQTFFTNPYLFNKYVYPVVFNTHSTNTRTNTWESMMYPVDRQMMNVDRVLDNGVWDKDTLLSQYKNVLPIDTTLYNKYMNVYPMNTMYPTTTSNTMMSRLPYITTMDKLFNKNMMINKMMNKPELEVITDVKVMDKKVDGQIVDPIKYTKDYKIVDGQIVPVIADRKIDLEDIIARRPIDRTMIDDLIVRKPTMITTDDLFTRKPIIDELFGEEKFNKFNTFEGKNMNIKDAILRRMLLNKMMNGDRKIDELFPEMTNTNEIMMKNIPLFEKIEKMNRLNRLENIEGKMMNMDKFEKMMTIPTTTNFDDEMTTMTRTPTIEDLLRNKDLFNNKNIQMTKEMKDFILDTPMNTMMTQDKIFGDNKIMYTNPTEFKTIIDLDRPTTKTVIV